MVRLRAVALRHTRMCCACSAAVIREGVNACSVEVVNRDGGSVPGAAVAPAVLHCAALHGGASWPHADCPWHMTTGGRRTRGPPTEPRQLSGAAGAEVVGGGREQRIHVHSAVLRFWCRLRCAGVQNLLVDSEQRAAEVLLPTL